MVRFSHLGSPVHHFILKIADDQKHLTVNSYGERKSRSRFGSASRGESGAGKIPCEIDLPLLVLEVKLLDSAPFPKDPWPELEEQGLVVGIRG